jgi:hypothetical protein
MDTFAALSLQGQIDALLELKTHPHRFSPSESSALLTLAGGSPHAIVSFTARAVASRENQG